MDSAIGRAKEIPDVQLCERGGPSFTGTAGDCKRAYELVAKSYPFTLEKSESVLEDQLCTYPEKDVLKPIVLMPSIVECCGHPVTVRNRLSFPLVFATRGTCVGAAFSAKCRSPSCGRRYFPSHYEVPQIGIADCDELQYQQFFYDPESNGPYFQTSQTVFEISLLCDITSNITISGTSFESRAVVYNENFRQLTSNVWTIYTHLAGIAKIESTLGS